MPGVAKKFIELGRLEFGAAVCDKVIWGLACPPKHLLVARKASDGLPMRTAQAFLENTSCTARKEFHDLPACSLACESVTTSAIHFASSPVLVIFPRYLGPGQISA